LQKAKSGETWTSLEALKQVAVNNVITDPNVVSRPNEFSTLYSPLFSCSHFVLFLFSFLDTKLDPKEYPSSRKKVNWDEIEKEVEKEEAEEKLTGDAALNKLFQKIYGGADPVQLFFPSSSATFSSFSDLLFRSFSL
jgi:hypothetical protein